MAGDEEALARATLVEMQGRISRGPNTALGVAAEATPEQVRAAFLELTKRFHPARFGRMSVELQRLSNEVFLGIKSAHETMMRGLGAPMRTGLGSGPRTGAIPIVAVEGTARTGVARGTQGPQPALPRTMTPTRSPSPPTRSPSSPSPSPPSTTSTRAPSSPSPSPPSTTSTPAPGAGFGVRLGTPPGTRPGTPPTTRPGTPPGTAAPTPPMLPPKPMARDPETVRGGVGQRTAPVFDERLDLQQALDLVAAKNWAGARQAFQALAARVPQSKQYRGFLCYARGREAQVAGRGEEAVLEFQRALQLDPEQSHAKSALAELLRRR